MDNCFDFDEDGPNGADVALLLLSKPVNGFDDLPKNEKSVAGIYRNFDEAGKDFVMVGQYFFVVK